MKLSVQKTHDGHFRILTERGTPLGPRFIKGKAGTVDPPDGDFLFASESEANQAKAKWLRYFYAQEKSRAKKK